MGFALEGNGGQTSVVANRAGPGAPSLSSILSPSVAF